MNSSYTILSLPKDERPRERLLQGEVVSTTELLAIVLGSGMRGKPVLQLAQELLAAFGTVEALAQATVAELCQIKGMGFAKAVQVKAAFALGGRAAAGGVECREKIVSPQHAYAAVRSKIEDAPCECFAVLLLDVRCQLISVEVIARGTLSEAAVHPRELFYPAIRHKAARLILAHNHPSGDPTPSPDDYSATETFIAAGRMMGIPIDDHLIVGRRCYFSLREHGFVFN